MNLTLKEDEVLKFIHSALCNGGLNELHLSGIELIVDLEHYKTAKEKLVKPNLEDVWIQLLKDGKALTFRDHEAKEDISFTLPKAVTELNKYDALDTIVKFKQEQDDAWSGFELIQFCLYGEIRYS